MKDIIDKAVKGGFKWSDIDPDMATEYKFLDDTGDFVTVESGSVTVAFSNEEIIFSPDFLKAYFGEEAIRTCSFCGKFENIKSKEPEASCCGCSDGTMLYQEHAESAWQYHAQQLVLAEDRIEYLRRYI